MYLYSCKNWCIETFICEPIDNVVEEIFKRNSKHTIIL